MNTTHRAKAGAGMLLLSALAFLDNVRDDLREFLGVGREHGKFRLVGIQPDAPGKRAMLGAALAGLAVLLLGGGLLAGGSLAHLLAVGTLAAGAAGVFTLERPADAPLPQYTFVGVYVGGTSDYEPVRHSVWNLQRGFRKPGVGARRGADTGRVRTAGPWQHGRFCGDTDDRYRKSDSDLHAG